MNINRKIALDTETTGLDVSKGDRIIEIGCVEIVNGCLTGNTFHVFVNPECDISKSAIKVHGITLEDLEDKPNFAEIADEFNNFVGDDTIIAHNAKFDVGFLNYEMMRAKKRKIIQWENVFDTLQLARKMFPGAPASLDALCKRFKISLAQRTFHGALLDAQLLSRVYLELINGSQSSLLFDMGSMQNQVESKKRYISKRNYINTSDEIEAHEKFIAKINNPIWNK
jgi:DNA polymerase-3 subunit epsilon